MFNHWVVHLKLIEKEKKNVFKWESRDQQRTLCCANGFNFLKWKLDCQSSLFPIATRIQCNMLTYCVRKLIYKWWSSWLKWTCLTNRPRVILHSSTPVFPPRINHSSYRKLLCEVKNTFPLSIPVLWLCNVSTWSSCTFSFLCGIPRRAPPSHRASINFFLWVLSQVGLALLTKETSIFYLTPYHHPHRCWKQR